MGIPRVRCRAVLTLRAVPGKCLSPQVASASIALWFGRIISSRAGQLGSWTLHNDKAETKIEALEVKAGETIDFVVDFNGNLNSDDFKWPPVVRTKDQGAGAPSGEYAVEWSAKKDFSGPPEPPPKPLSAWEKYAQVLLLSNEFMFVD